MLGNASSALYATGGAAAAGSTSAATVTPPSVGINQISQANLTDFLNNPGSYIRNTLVRSGIGAALNTAVYGGSFGTAFANNVVSSAASIAADGIGDLNTPADGSSPNMIASVVEHAILGCATSAAEGTGCAGGAIGAGTSAIVSPLILDGIDSDHTPLSDGQLALVNALAALSGGGIAALFGGDASAAATAAENDSYNNSTKHWVMGILCIVCNYVMENPADTITDPSGGRVSQEDVDQINKGNEFKPLPLPGFTQNPPKK